MMEFVLSYDISDPKRLAKCAKILENKAIRIQKSVFFMPDTQKDEISKIADMLAGIIDKKHDDVRIYTVDSARSLYFADAVDLGDPLMLSECCKDGEDG